MISYFFKKILCLRFLLVQSCTAPLGEWIFDDFCRRTVKQGTTLQGGIRHKARKYTAARLIGSILFGYIKA